MSALPRRQSQPVPATPGGLPSHPLSEAATDRPVDLVHLARQTFGQRSLEKEVLGLFLAQAESHAGRLGEALGPEEVRKIAHLLQGSARAIGAWVVARAAEEVETVPGDRDRIALLRASIDATAAYISALLED